MRALAAGGLSLVVSLVAAIGSTFGLGATAQDQPPGTDLAAQAAYSVGDPADLPRGRNAEGIYLLGDQLHLLSGRWRQLRLGQAGYLRLALLGHVDGGWLVVRHREATRRGYREMQVLRVRGREREEIFRTTVGDATYVGLRARPAGEVAAVITDRGGTRFLIFDSDGEVVARRARIGRAGRILEFTNDGLTASSPANVGVWRWRPGEGVERVLDGFGSDYANRSTDLLAVQPTGDPTQSGITTYADPGPPPWLRQGLRVADGSPGNLRILGTIADDAAVLDRATGDVIRRWSFRRAMVVDPMWWEWPGSVIVGVRTRQGSVLVRCRVRSGACVRASKWVTGRDEVTIPWQTDAHWYD